MTDLGSKKFNRRQIVQGLTIAPAAGLVFSAVQPSSILAADDVVRYGVSGPFSGPFAEYGRIWKAAMGIAVDEINEAGGINGRTLELVYEDSQTDPKQSVPIAQKFVGDKSILAELGDFASPASMAASPIYERAKMVQFGTNNSHPDFTTGGKYMFSLVLSQEQDASILAQTAFDMFGPRQAVLYRNTDWGKTTADIYADKIKELGGEIVAFENYLETEKDFRSILAKVRDAKPDITALISYYTDGALLVQQAKSVGLETNFVANGACYSPEFIELGGDAANGVVMTTVFFPGDPRPEVQAFVEKYREKTGQDPDQFGALAYDGVKILAWATERGGFDRQAIRKEMAEGKDIPSIIYGPFEFSDIRRVEKATAAAIVVKDGAFILVSQS